MNIWTKRGAELNRQDKDVIGSIARKSAAAAQIFMTGELYGKRIIDEEEGLLMAANDMVDEPLFVRTKADTIQMSRFDPAVVWKLIHPDAVERMLNRESARFGIENMNFDTWDFCYSLVQHFKVQYGELQIPVTKERNLAAFYQTMYLSALFIFEKPGYMTVPASQYFALPETEEYFKSLTFRPLRTEEVDQMLELQKQHGDVEGLTNKELRFLLDRWNAELEL
jgi:hypothetical protein